MNRQALNRPVDVLAVLDVMRRDMVAASELLTAAECQESRAARSAVAELIEADKEYDGAMHSEADTYGMLRRESARARRKAALANIGSVP